MISCQDFAYLAKDRSPRLKVFAKRVAQKQPTGKITTAILDELIKVAKMTQQKDDVTWLQSLKQMITSGRLERIAAGEQTWNEHSAEVRHLVKAKKIPFQIQDMVMLKGKDRVGKVVDYLVDEDMYLVALDPFQIMKVTPSDLENVKMP